MSSRTKVLPKYDQYILVIRSLRKKYLGAIAHPFLEKLKHNAKYELDILESLFKCEANMTKYRFKESVIGFWDIKSLMFAWSNLFANVNFSPLHHHGHQQQQQQQQQGNQQFNNNNNNNQSKASEVVYGSVAKKLDFSNVQSSYNANTGLTMVNSIQQLQQNQLQSQQQNQQQYQQGLQNVGNSSTVGSYSSSSILMQLEQQQQLQNQQQQQQAAQLLASINNSSNAANSQQQQQQQYPQNLQNQNQIQQVQQVQQAQQQQSQQAQVNNTTTTTTTGGASSFFFSKIPKLTFGNKQVKQQQLQQQQNLANKIVGDLNSNDTYQQHQYHHGGPISASPTTPAHHLFTTITNDMINENHFKLPQQQNSQNQIQNNNNQNQQQQSPSISKQQQQNSQNQIQQNNQNQNQQIMPPHKEKNFLSRTNLYKWLHMAMSFSVSKFTFIFHDILYSQDGPNFDTLRALVTVDYVSWIKSYSNFVTPEAICLIYNTQGEQLDIDFSAGYSMHRVLNKQDDAPLTGIRSWPCLYSYPHDLQRDMLMMKHWPSLLALILDNADVLETQIEPFAFSDKKTTYFICRVDTRMHLVTIVPSNMMNQKASKVTTDFMVHMSKFMRNAKLFSFLTSRDAVQAQHK